MSRWADARKARLAKPPVLDAIADLEVRVGRRICKVIYHNNNEGCACEAQGRNMVCDTMKSAAQHVMQEIMGK